MSSESIPENSMEAMTLEDGRSVLGSSAESALESRSMKSKLGKKISASTSSGFLSGEGSDDEVQQIQQLGYDIMRFNVANAPIDSQKVKEITGYLENHGSTGPQVERYLRNILNAWQLEGSNIAILGDSQCGKSLLINYLTGKRAMYKDKVKLPKKNCKKPKSYEHQLNNKLLFWEIPLGQGYEKYGNKKTYWEAINGDRYDAFIILTKNYCKNLMVWLSNHLKETGKPHMIARTFIDEAIDTSQAKYPLSHNAERIQWNALKFLRESYVENGGTIDDETNFFVIGSMEPTKYDMPKILDSLLNDSTETVRKSLALSVPPMSPSVIEMKVRALRERIWMIAIESAAAGARVCGHTNIYADYKMMKDELNLYRKQLSITDEVLDLVSKMDDPLAGISSMKHDNKFLAHILEEGIKVQDDDNSVVQQIKNVSFRWWLTHQKAAPTFSAVSGLMHFLLSNFEDLSLRMLHLDTTENLNECAV